MDSKDTQKIVNSLKDIRSAMDQLTREIKTTRKSVDQFVTTYRQVHRDAAALENQIPDPVGEEKPQ